jgi:3-oxoacyl-[acyl-carrier protein] reductase
MRYDFAGKTVIVTGAAHGFGRGIAHAFAELGASVWACDVVQQELEETAASAPGLVQIRTVDITDERAVAGFIQELTGHDGRLDILVNNAGGVLGQVGQPVETVSASDWRDIFAVNVDGAFYFSKHAAPFMKESRRGRIINIASGAGLGVSLTGIQAYASAKAALIGLTRQLAHELGAWNITVNSVAPGFIRSNPTTERQWNAYTAEKQKHLVEGIALKRLGRTEDIVHAVLFFASDYADWISGQILSVDGGK